MPICNYNQKKYYQLITGVCVCLFMLLTSPSFFYQLVNSQYLFYYRENHGLGTDF